MKTREPRRRFGIHRDIISQDGYDRVLLIPFSPFGK
jgi:hypothetical protein